MSRVLVLCPDYPAPSGGVRKLYRHVDVLNRNGIASLLVHIEPGFRCSWFANDTRVAYRSDLRLTADDVLVVPEVFGPGLAALAPGVRKVVFNQNAYLTFVGYSVDPLDLRTPYTHPEVVAALVVSEDNREYLEFAFPGLRLIRLHYGIDTELFSYRGEKKKRIAYMPRKNAQDVVQVVNLLKQRGALTDIELVAIDGRGEAEVAAVLGECAVFLSFGQPEGCPLPPLEAMSRGCVVVGYHGRGGGEYFRPEFCRSVEVGDVVGFARAVEEVLSLPETELAAMGAAASAFVRETYSPAREEADILQCWRTLAAKR